MRRHAIVPAAGLLLLTAILLLPPAAFGVAPVAVKLVELSAGPTGPAGAQFGAAVAAGDDTIVVGAPSAWSDYGAAYVFERQADETWARTTLTPADPGPDHFGFSVALDGDTAAVSAPWNTNAQGAAAGAVYIFTRSAGVWSQTQKLTCSASRAADHTGYSVGISGDTIVVGSGDTSRPEGVVTIFTRSGATWTEQYHNYHYGATTGWATAITSGGLFAFSEPLYPALTPNDTGFVMGMTWDGSAATGALVTVPAGLVNDAWFGSSLALSGTTLVAGANNQTVSGLSGAGAAYVYTATGTDWPYQGPLVPDDPEVNAAFGHNVAASGDLAISSATEATEGGTAHAGAVYVFQGDAGVWSQSLKLTRFVPAVGDRYGAGLSMSGSMLVAGAPGALNSDSVVGGVADVYLVDDTLPVTKAALTPWPNAAGWSKTAEKLTLKGVDTQTGINHASYRLGTSGSWHEYSRPIDVTAQGVSTYQAYSVDLVGNHGDVVDVVVRTDWSRPVTAAYAGSLRKGKAGILSFKVSDRARGSQANVSLKIYKGKRLKKTIKAGVYLCNVRAKCHWTCSLPRGTYTLKVSATDLAGNKQSKIGSARLTVR